MPLDREVSQPFPKPWTDGRAGMFSRRKGGIDVNQAEVIRVYYEDQCSHFKI